ncbi:MAG: ROK family protein [Ruminococcaceae bacterium]|nr:ROK family protein [Oscillospiraceae bacterium]
MEYRIGVDIGGTSVKLAVVDSDFKVINKLRFPTGEEATSQGIIDGIIENCRTLMEDYPITAVGIGSAGRVDQKAGTVVVAGNLPFRNEPVVEKVSTALGVPVFIDNDGYTALIGEIAAGVCKGCQDALIITIGTGIGGAILLEGRLIRGRENRAGELGHFIVKMDGIQCECGLKGCFERYASATGLIEQTEEAVKNNPESILALEAKNGINGKTPFDAKEKGCPVATELLSEYGRIFAAGLNSLIHIFQPEVIALSGGVSNQGDNLLDLIKPHLLPNANVKVTTLQSNGGIIGAALLGTEYAE